MAKPRHQAPKGTADHLFDDLELRQEVWRRILTVLKSYGFREIQTPAIEHIEVLSTKAGQEVYGQIYEFEDKGGRRLGLKSDITAAVARVVAAKAPGLQKPIRIAVHDRVYRYERPQMGRMREFWHINAEMFGATGHFADAELLACFVDSYVAVGLEAFEIRISDRNLLGRLLASWGVMDSQAAAVIRVLDKRLKLPRNEWTDELLASGFPNDKLPDLEKVLGLGGQVDDLSGAMAALGHLPDILPVLDRLGALGEALVLFGVHRRCCFDFSIARSSEYYTGLIFECFHAPTSDGHSYGAIGGGGRYDNLVETYGGTPIEAAGFAIGFERVILLLQSLDLAGRLQRRPPEVYVGYSTPDATERACRIAQPEASVLPSPCAALA